MQRRTLLRLGLASGAVLALAGGGMALLYAPGMRDGQLTAAGRAVFAAVARGVLDGSLPVEPKMQEAALSAHLDRLDEILRVMSPHTQGEVAELLVVLNSAPGRLAMAGLTPDWLQASVAQLQVALQGMRVSRISLRQQAYHALRDLTHAAYFSGSATWVQLGYPGPTKLD